jgi:hypothetical protein
VGEIVRSPPGSIDIVTEGGYAFARASERTEELNSAERRAFSFGDDFFEPAAVFTPAFDDFFHHALRAFGLARADRVADVHDYVIILDNADPVIVEPQNLQGLHPPVEFAPIFAIRTGQCQIKVHRATP